MEIPGIGSVNDLICCDFTPLETGGGGLFRVGKEGVRAIYTPLDRVVELIVHEEKTLVYINSKMGCWMLCRSSLGNSPVTRLHLNTSLYASH